MPFQGIYDQKAVSDVLRIRLEQVYTQLATTLVEREVFDRPQLQQTDLLAFAAEHFDERLLPAALRREVLLRHASSEDTGSTHTAPTAAASSVRKQEERLDLRYFSRQELAAVAQQLDRLCFFGPQFVIEAIASNQRLVVIS
jgi:hypothetical protein